MPALWTPDELELREQGKRHLQFACSLARWQVQGGRVLFECRGVRGAVVVEVEVDGWRALCSMRPVSVRNDFG